MRENEGVGWNFFFELPVFFNSECGFSSESPFTPKSDVKTNVFEVLSIIIRHIVKCTVRLFI